MQDHVEIKVETDMVQSHGNYGDADPRGDHDLHSVSSYSHQASELGRTDRYSHINLFHGFESFVLQLQVPNLNIQFKGANRKCSMARVSNGNLKTCMYNKLFGSCLTVDEI